MIEQPYPYIEFKTHLYLFESIGAQGSILKVVELTYQKNGNWNLGFGDLVKGQISDSVITNNQDVRKVIGTVAKIAIDFLMEHPERIIEIEPIDEKRETLYNYVFQKHFDEIDALFDIRGIINEEEEPYVPTKTYTRFTIKSKF